MAVPLVELVSFDAGCSMASNSIESALHIQIGSGIAPEKQTQSEMVGGRACWLGDA